MKKITAIVSTVLLLIGACFAQSTNINDYALEDIYLYYGNIEQLGQKFSSTYSFSKTPEFAAETDNYYTALINKKNRTFGTYSRANFHSNHYGI